MTNYSCLQTGDNINIHYNGWDYAIWIVETKPDPVISIIEADINLEFEEPVDYANHLKMKKKFLKVQKEEAKKVEKFVQEKNLKEKIVWVDGKEISQK